MKNLIILFLISIFFGFTAKADCDTSDPNSAAYITECPPPAVSNPTSASGATCTSSYKNESYTTAAGGTDPLNPNSTCGSDGQWSTSETSNNNSSDVNQSASGADAGAPKVSSTDPCSAAYSQALNICQGSTGAAIAQAAGGMGAVAGASSANAGAACKMQAEVASAEAATMLTFVAACEYEINSCKTACDPGQVPADSSTAVTTHYANNLTNCGGLQSYATKYGLQAAADSAQALAAKQCASAYAAAAAATPIPVLAETCVGNAEYAATHTLECYCASNPSDVKCLNAALTQNPSGLALPTSSSSLGKALTASPSGDGAAVPNIPNAGAPINPAAAGATAGGGGYGGGSPATAAMAATPDDNPPAAGAANGGAIFGGFSAGQGGFSYGSAKGDGSGGGLMGAAKALATKLNMANLLPKRDNFVNRAVAGMSVSAADGVTGPNGPSLWEKVSRRYQIKKGDLLPP